MNHPGIDRQVSLRRADWRFLLPGPPDGAFQHLVLPGGPPALAERIVEIGVARSVSCEIPRRRSADAVIVLHDAQVALDAAAGCLLPGGALYYEVERRSPASRALGPGRIRRALRDAGLSPAGIYWARPHFAECQMYLPLDIPGALRWYLAALFTAATPAQRLLEPGLHALARFERSLFALPVSCYAFTAVAGAARAAPPSILDHPALPAELRRPDLRPIALTQGDDFNRVVLLPFAPGGARPLAVLKLGRLPECNHAIAHEQAALATLRPRLDAALRGTIPQPLGTFEWGQLAVGVESCAPGRQLSASTGRWGTPLRRKIENLRLAAAWLAAFNRQAQAGRSSWDEPELKEWVEMPLAAYEQAFGMTAAEERLFAAARRRARALAGTPLPSVWVHWGFDERNLFRAHRAITVIDWEGGSVGPPLFDLLYFVTQWSYTARHLHGEAARLRGFRELFFEPDQGGAALSAARAEVAGYMAELGIARDFLPLLLVLLWVARALGRFNRQGAASEPGANARSGNQYVGYIDVLAGHVEQLFAETYGM